MSGFGSGSRRSELSSWMISTGPKETMAQIVDSRVPHLRSRKKWVDLPFCGNVLPVKIFSDKADLRAEANAKSS